MSLKHSLRDAESLLLDANRERSQNSQEMLTLQEEMRKIKEENLRCSSFEEELLKLREEEKRLKKAIVSLIHFVSGNFIIYEEPSTSVQYCTLLLVSDRNEVSLYTHLIAYYT